MQLLIDCDTNISNIVNYSIKLGKAKMVVIYDDRSELSKILASSYSKLTYSKYIHNFDEVIGSLDLVLQRQSFEDIVATLEPDDAVVLIQSSSFRLDNFRIRIHLFNKGLKVIEHTHLNRYNSLSIPTYIESLRYDKKELEYYIREGGNYETSINNCNGVIIKSGGYTLSSGLLEKCKLNIGQFKEGKNIGGTYPIGEVFTECQNLSTLNGQARVYAFANKNFEVEMVNPFTINIEDGIVIGYSDGAPLAFVEIYNIVKNNETPYIREIGFGLNRAQTRSNYLPDITAFERIKGIHLSMGEKHSVYKKDHIVTHKSRFHIDIFIESEIVTFE